MEIKEKRTDLYHVKLDRVIVIDGFNVRKDYGDIEALAASIQQNGILKPLDAYKKDGMYHLVDGHRRIEAVKLLASKGIEILIPIRPESKGISEEQRIVNMVVANDSKPLNYVEMADVVVRLQSYGWSDKEISDKLSWQQSQISFLRLLNSASKKVKDYIANGYISAAEAVNLLRNDSNDALTIIELAIEEKYGSLDNVAKVDLDGSKKKHRAVTKKDIDKVIGRHDSIKYFKKILKQDVLPNKNIDAFFMIKNIINGDISEESLYELFYQSMELEYSDLTEEEMGAN